MARCGWCVRGLACKKKKSEKAWIYTETVTKDNCAILFAYTKLWNYTLRSVRVSDKSQGVTKAKNPDNRHGEHLTARVSLQKARRVFSDKPFEDCIFEPHYYTKFFFYVWTIKNGVRYSHCLSEDSTHCVCFTWTLILSRFQFLHSFILWQTLKVAHKPQPSTFALALFSQA